MDSALLRSECNEINFLLTVPQYLTRITSRGFSEFGEYCNGYLDSLKVHISQNKVKISDSLCKYYLGDNFKTLSKGDTRRAIEKISDHLHLPFQLADVYRIDAAQNLIMQYDEKLYYAYLGEAQYYKRGEQNNGLYYNTQKRQLVFYGKVYEQKSKGQYIPPLYENRNVLRYEIRFLTRLREQFNKDRITTELLYDEVFYNNLVKRWKDEYLAIQKINNKLKYIRPTGSTKEMAKSLALLSIMELGQPAILNMLQEWQTRGKITKKQAYDHRKWVKQLCQMPIDGNDNELIMELDRKIKEAARYS